MLFPNKENIIRANRSIIDSLENENRIINFKKRLLQLESFREAMSEYVCGYEREEPDCECLTSKVSILPNGHLLDHHALGYFAPMEFERWGFEQNGKPMKRSHIDQIKILNDFFVDHGVRFIYVPIPCKVAVDPYIAVDKDVVPYDQLVIPQWRKVLLDIAYEGIECVDCYAELKKTGRASYTKNHHISPIGAGIIADKVAEYIYLTTEGLKEDCYANFLCKDEYLGSPVLLNSGNNNSAELGEEFFETTRVFIRDDEFERPYMGRDSDSEIVIIGDCNLQSYRGTGADVTSQISGALKYPVGYLGRYLPFAKHDSIDKLPMGSLYGKAIIIYIGFISGSFVRANHVEDTWSMKLPAEGIFM